MAHAYNPRTWKTEVGGLLWVQGQLGLNLRLHREILSLKEKKIKEEREEHGERKEEN